ncbi:DUF3999 family protein [uncultured Formosa sp.]|uniref:DUF3999 family protein n=1 Tax=uncultured Formosa sp. TaxID=255435 RepID=UPI002625B301|nr:DUF3999 family protein [uncultured Formosa sp.]
MKLLINVLVMLSVITVFAQDHTVTGNIDPVQADGLHLISIPHTVRSYANPNMSDFRIWDSTGHQVPYFMQPETYNSSTTVSNFSPFTILSSRRVADTSATYIFKNPNATLKQAVLSIANYQGRKHYRLEGSHDQDTWFGIVNRGELQDLNDPDAPSVYKVIDFPLCNYAYLKLVFDDRNSLPLNLLKIGSATTESVNVVPQTMETLPIHKLSFSEVDKTTTIHMHFERPEIINQLKLDITSPELYSRNAILYTLGEREVNRNTETYRQLISSFTIRSDRPLVFNVPSHSVQDLYVEIANKDNPKLELSSLEVLQHPLYVVANLKATHTYTITAGNETLTAPDYDISEVTNTLKHALPLAKISNVTYVAPKATVAASASFWQHPWFMWCCIGFAALIIAFYAFNLIKDLNASKS